MNKVAKTLSFLLLLICFGCEEKPPYKIPKYPEIEQDIYFESDYPPIVQVVYEKDGYSYHVDAVQGQIIVMFEETVSHTEAFEILKNNHTKIVAQLPQVHYYLVEVPIGKEGEFICLMRKIPKIDYVCPNTIEEICSVTSYVLDNFYGTHGERVVAMMKGDNQDMFVSTDNVGIQDGKYIYRNKAFESAKRIISNLGKGESVVINMSFGPSVNKDIKNIDERSADYKNNYIDDLKLWKDLVLCYDDKDFVIVKASGNNGIKNLEDGLDKFRDGLSQTEIETFERHFILVSAKDGNSEYPNDVSIGHYDRLVTKVDISDISWDGTSFSSPRAAGYIAKAADAHGMKVTEVLKHVRKATEVNKDNVFTAKSLDAVIKIAQNNASIGNEEGQNSNSTVGNNGIQNNNHSIGESTQQGIPNSLVGTKWTNNNKLIALITIEFVDQYHLKYRKKTIFYDWEETIFDCYYDSKMDQIVALVGPGTFNFKYEGERLFSLNYYISFGGWTKTFEYIRL